MSDEHKVKGIIGDVRGEGVIRDPNGKVKQRFSFGGPATAEQANRLKEVFGNANSPNDFSPKRSS